MWGSLVGLSLLVTLHPVRLGVILLVISRPRPVQNLLAYWAGCIMVSLPSFLIPLLVVHVTPSFTSFTKNLATPGTVVHSTAGRIEIGAGVLALSIAVVMAVLFAARRGAQPQTADRGRHRLHTRANTSTLVLEWHAPGRGRHRLHTRDNASTLVLHSNTVRNRHRMPTRDNTSTPVLDSNTPPAISRLLGRVQDGPTEGGSAIRRLLRRTHTAWENGSLWVAWVIGLAMAPSFDGVLLILAIIVASGATIGMQVSAVLVFILGMFAVEEIMLASYLITPAKTQAIVRVLHDWTLTHRRKVVVAVFAVLGFSLAAHGMGSI